jgi:hypothetical protein
MSALELHASESPTEGAAGSTSTETKIEGEPADDGGEPTLLEDSDPPPFHKHERWQQMLRENRELKKNASDPEAKAKADQFEALVAQLSKAGISVNELGYGVELMRLMRHDPTKAFESLQPFMTRLAQHVGAAIPEDLQKQVEMGAITEAAAVELSKARSERAFLQSQLRDRDEQELTESNNRSITERKTAIQAWEKTWRTSDPDYQKKQPFVKDKLHALIQTRGIPKTPEDAVAMAQEAREAIDKQLGSVVPRKQERRVVTGGDTSQVQPKPKTMAEAVRAGLERTRG